ncbi:PucR family transcriptional regulator [Cytobacillus firmus]|uniref:helix-turn-helix domain-containing protein n=1 Tax=Cytobacillus firmus TaxID=1399 RepID=UPI00384F241B
MITLKDFADVLERDHILQVSGGSQNMNKEIAYLTSMELTEKTSRMKEKGFVMTTFHAFKNVKQIISHLEWMQEIGISAIGFHTAALKTIPKEIIDYSNTHSFPLFEIPQEVPYYIIHEKYNQLVNKKENEQASKIHRLNEKLMEIVLLEKDLNSIVKVIGEYINNVVCVLDPYFDLIAYWKTKEQTRSDIKHLINLIINQHKENVLKVRFTNRETNITVKRDSPSDQNFKVAPLFSKMNFLGYLIICQNGKADKFSEEVIKNGIRALSLAAYNKNTLLHYQKSKDIEMLEGIFQGEPDDKSLSDFYMDLKKVRCIFQVQSSSPETIQSKLQMLSESLIENETNSRLWIYNRKIVGVIDSILDRERVATLLTNYSGIRIGVSAIDEVNHISKIKAMYDQSSMGLLHGHIHDAQLVFWDEMGIEKIAYNLKSHHLFQNFDEELLGPLIAYDLEKNASLTETLYTYLKHFFNLQKSSSELFVHPNTVKYRLQKITELMQVDIQNPSHYSMLMMAFSIYRFKQKADHFQ